MRAVAGAAPSTSPHVRSGTPNRRPPNHPTGNPDMDFPELIADFAVRHGIADLAADAAAKSPSFGTGGFVQM